MTQWDKYKLNWIQDPEDKRDIKFKSILPKEDLPLSIDLREVYGEIFDQGSLGSCTSNSVSGCLRMIMKNQNANSLSTIAKWSFTPSRLFIYYHGRFLMGQSYGQDLSNYDTGLSIRDGFKSIDKFKYCDEIYWPYDISFFSSKPNMVAYKDSRKIKQTLYVKLDDEYNMKLLLSQGKPISFGINIYDSFYQTKNDGLIKTPDWENEQIIGGHAMLIIGYDDLNKFWIIVNSWSDKWGEKGFGYLPYDYLKKDASDFWSIQKIDFTKTKDSKILEVKNNYIKKLFLKIKHD